MDESMYDFLPVEEARQVGEKMLKWSRDGEL